MSPLKADAVPEISLPSPSSTSNDTRSQNVRQLDGHIRCCSNGGMTSDACLIYKSLYCAYSRNWHTSLTRGSGIKTAGTKKPPLFIAPHKLQLKFVLSAGRLITRYGWCHFNTLLRKLQFHYPLKNSPSQHPILSQVNPVHTPTPFFLNPTLVPHCLLPNLALRSPFLPSGFLTWSTDLYCEMKGYSIA